MNSKFRASIYYFIFSPLFYITMLLNPNPASAVGSIDQATIVNIQMIDTGTGAILVYVDSNIGATPPTCVNPTWASRRFALAANTQIRQAMISALLAVQGEGHKIRIDGTGACDVWGDTETINDIETE